MDTQTPRWWRLDDSFPTHETLAMPVPGGLVLQVLGHDTEHQAAPAPALCFVPCISIDVHQWLVRASQDYRSTCEG